MKSNFNTIVKTHHIYEFEEFFEYFNEINYGSLNYDALWKWSGILHSFYELFGSHPKFDKCIDIGGGLSPIHLILSNYGKIINVDDCSQTGGKFAAWYPVKKDGVFYEESNGFEYCKENIEYVNSDIQSYLKSVPDNSIDIFVDGCSLIHGNVISNYSFHDGFLNTSKEIYRTLKSGGYFISCSDIYNPILKKSYPNLLRHDGITYPDNLYKLLTESKLNPMDDLDYDVEDFYKNFQNTLISIPNAPFYKRLNPEYSIHKNLPKYHAFSQIQDKPMLIGRFVFKK
jgi:hypothetical protein